MEVPNPQRSLRRKLITLLKGLKDLVFLSGLWMMSKTRQEAKEKPPRKRTHHDQGQRGRQVARKPIGGGWTPGAPGWAWKSQVEGKTESDWGWVGELQMQAWILQISGQSWPQHNDSSLNQERPSQERRNSREESILFLQPTQCLLFKVPACCSVKDNVWASQVASWGLWYSVDWLWDPKLPQPSALPENHGMKDSSRFPNGLWELKNQRLQFKFLLTYSLSRKKFSCKEQNTSMWASVEKAPWQSQASHGFQRKCVHYL